MALVQSAKASPHNMTSSRSREANRGFFSLILASVLFHSGAVGAAIYIQGRTPRIDLNLESMPVELVSLGKARDPDLLPRKAPVAAAPDPDGIALDGIKPKKPRRKPKNRPKPRRKLSAAAKKLLQGRDEDLDRALSKIEREGSEDGFEEGTTTNPTEAATAYEAEVASMLRSRYQLPNTIPPSQRRFLEAELVLFIDRKGQITKYEYIKKHNNQAFMNALESLLRSLKLPAPPVLLTREYATKGLAVRFKPD